MDYLKLFSMIQPEIKRRLLIRGMILGGAGACTLLIFGVWAPLTVLDTWGILLFLLAKFMIGWGLIPYKKLTRLETHPHQILLENRRLIFVPSKGKEKIIPYSEIRKITYFESKTKYGLKVDTKAFQIVLPYFSSDPRLHEIVHADQPNKCS